MERRGGNETHLPPADHQWSFTSWKVKVFFWNPKRKDFKTVRWCQKSPVLRVRKSYQVIFQNAGENTSNKVEAFRKPCIVYMNCGNIFLLPFYFWGTWRHFMLKVPPLLLRQYPSLRIWTEEFKTGLAWQGKSQCRVWNSHRVTGSLEDTLLCLSTRYHLTIAGWGFYCNNLVFLDPVHKPREVSVRVIQSTAWEIIPEAVSTQNRFPTNF